MTNTLYTRQIHALEAAIAQKGIDFYLVPMVDEFQGEYIPAYAARLPFVTGFTGSAGMGVFWGAPSESRKHTLFVDGRYTLQAAKEVDTSLVTILNSGDVSFSAWLAQFAEQKIRIGFDPWLVTIQQLQQWKKASAQWDMEWVAQQPNLVDRLWADQPAPPTEAVQLHPFAFAGRRYAEKRADVIATLTQNNADALLLTQPDAINWLLNIRGADVPFNPLLLGYLILTRDGQATLYTHDRTWSDEVRAYFAENNIATANIATVFEGDMRLFPAVKRVMMDAASVPHGWELLAEKANWNIITADDPTQLPKAIKNPVELDGIRAAHLRDGRSLTKFLHWFDQGTARNKFPMELEAIAKLESFRTQENSYRGASFATIAGAGEHGAIIHYRADETSNRKVRAGELFLLDSGGQYPDGTTDVTRTIAVGAPSPAMKEHFTRVLKGHIALASVQFPTGTSGGQLDVLARQYLWEAGLDYDHGTGHGVGAYLCVHEGPQRIGKRGAHVPLVPGMILSNEPGYYAAGEYGIRIESLVAVVEASGVHGRPMLAFETLTLAPIDVRLIDIALLTSAERNWLNAYHRRVFDAHAPHIGGEVRSWLAQVTRAI